MATRLARADRFGGGFGAAIVAAVALAACGPGSTATAVIAVIGGPQILASDLAFQSSTLEVPAGVAFSLELVNRDFAPHNLSIYRDSTASEKVFGGAVVNAGSSTVYAVPAVAAGTWYFRCDIHPAMHGDVIADPTAGSPAVLTP